MKVKLAVTTCLALVFVASTANSIAQAKKPNILVIWGDDIGWYNPSIYHRGDMMQSVLNAAAKDPKIKATLVETAFAADKDLIRPLFEFRNNGRPVGNGWTSPPNGARWGTDYLSRAATAKSNMATSLRFLYREAEARF